MNYEQKHQEDLDAAKDWLTIAKKDNNTMAIQILENLFPELSESEDEKIRKELIAFLERKQLIPTETKNEWIAWLEKQGKQDNNEDLNILQRFSFYSYKDEPSILYLSGLYVNEECRNKGMGTKILEVADEVAKSLNCHAIRLKTKKDSNAERLYRTLGYNSLPTEERDEIWLEKQSEKSVCKVKIGETYKCIASPRYTCFRKDDIYHVKDNFVAELINTCSDCFVLLEKQGEQKPTDEVKPKFKIGDWVVQDNIGVFKIIEICKSWYEVIDIEDNHYSISFDNEHMCHLWTIKDVKDGDVLKEDSCIFITEKMKSEGTAITYCCLFDDGDFDLIGSTLSFDIDSTYPATKEQRDFLFQKMKDAGYEWDAEKKELKKTEQKTAWSEEDEKFFTTALWHISNSVSNGKDTEGHCATTEWLKSLKDRVQPQPKQPVNTVWYNNMDDLIADAMIDEINKSNLFSGDKYNCIYWINSHRNKTIEWSEEDEKMYQSIIDDTVQENQLDGNQIAWLKSIKPNHWKPSKEQIMGMEIAINILTDKKFHIAANHLTSIYNDIKKL